MFLKHIQISDFSNFEAYDASTLDYSAIRRQNGVEYEKIIGHAKTDAGQTGRADFNNPEGLHYDLPIGTLYPMKHTLNVVEAIQDNQKFYNAVVFDGSDDEGAIDDSAVVDEIVATEDIEPTSDEDATMAAAATEEAITSIQRNLEGLFQKIERSLGTPDAVALASTSCDHPLDRLIIIFVKEFKFVWNAAR